MVKRVNKNQVKEKVFSVRIVFWAKEIEMIAMSGCLQKEREMAKRLEK